MGRMLLVLLLCSLAPAHGGAQCLRFPHNILGKVLFEKTGDASYECRLLRDRGDDKARENPRLVAAILNVSLGLFGVHRLYLGTDVRIPVFYTLTIGGGGVLWLVDLGLILFTHDLSGYMDNPHVFMWVRDGEMQEPAP